MCHKKLNRLTGHSGRAFSVNFTPHLIFCAILGQICHQNFASRRYTQIMSGQGHNMVILLLLLIYFFLYSFFAFVCPGWFVHFVFWFYISCKYVYTLTDRRQFHLFMILCLFLLKMQQESYICGCIYMCVCLSVFMLCVL